MLQRRRTDIKADNGTSRRQMNPDNDLSSISHTRGDGFRQRNKNKIRLIILLLVTLFLLVLYNCLGDCGTINDTENKKTNNSINASKVTSGKYPYPPNKWSSAIEKIREEFYTRYGGKDEAMNMLERGVKTAADTEDHAVKHTAERIIRAVLKDSDNDSENGEQSETKRNKFIMSFGGYSVTVGRGNYFHQSYPFIMQKILKPIFEDLLNLELVVRNSAIGGIPSFPYGWCLPNFLGDDSDVISWDYGMNEGNGAEAFEAYLRQGVRSLSKRPMMIMLDSKKPRIDYSRHIIRTVF